MRLLVGHKRATSLRMSQQVVDAADGAPIAIEGCPFEITWKDGALVVRNSQGIGGMALTPTSGVEIVITPTEFKEFTRG